MTHDHTNAPLFCPFCGQLPVIGPLDPEREGNGWAWVGCQNESCHVRPRVEVYQISEEYAPAEGWDERPAKIIEAIRQWNLRPSTKSTGAPE